MGLPKGQGNGLIVVPNDDQPYFMQEVAVPDPPGIAPVPVEIALHAGIWIEGKVTDKETGSPVPGAWLHYFPFLENTFAQATPEFDSNDSQHDSRVRPPGPIPDQGGRYLPAGRPAGSSDRRGDRPTARSPISGDAGSESIKGMDEQGHFPT